MNLFLASFRLSRFTALWVLSCLALTLPALERSAAAPAVRRDGTTAGRTGLTSILAEEERLAQPVTLRFGKTPLHRVLAEVERQTRVPVSAETEIQDEPVVVHVRAQPAGAVLEQLSALLGWTWSRTGAGGNRRYQLLQGAAAEKRATELRRQRRLQMGRAVQSALEWRLRLTRRSAADLEALADRLTAVRAKPPQDLTEEDRLLLQSEDALRTAGVGVGPLRQSAAPVWKTLTRVAAELNAPQWEALLDGEIFWLSTRPLPRAQLLRPEREREFRAGRPTLPSAPERMLRVDPALAQLLNEAERDREEKWEAASGYCCRVEWVNWAPDWSAGTLRLEVAALPREADAQPTSGAVLEIRTAEAGPAEKLPLTPQHDTEPSPELDAARSWRNPRLLPAPQGGGTVDWLNHLLPQVAETYGINLIADGYRHPDHGFRLPQEGASVPLREVLDRSVFPLADWHQDGPFLRVRRREWFHARWVEPAASHVETWDQRLRNRPLVLPEDLLSLHATLQEEQVSCLSDALGDRGITFQMPLLLVFPGDRSALRAVTSLSRLQRAELRRDGEIPWDRLPPATQRHLQRSLDQSLTARLTPPPLAATQTLAVRVFALEHAPGEGPDSGYRPRRSANPNNQEPRPNIGVPEGQQKSWERMGLREVPDAILRTRHGTSFNYCFFLPIAAELRALPAGGASGSP